MTFIKTSAERFGAYLPGRPQLPENISERAAAVSESSYDFLQELKKFLAQ